MRTIEKFPNLIAKGKLQFEACPAMVSLPMDTMLYQLLRILQPTRWITPCYPCCRGIDLSVTSPNYFNISCSGMFIQILRGPALSTQPQHCTDLIIRLVALYHPRPWQRSFRAIGHITDQIAAKVSDQYLCATLDSHSLPPTRCLARTGDAPRWCKRLDVSNDSVRCTVGKPRHAST
jgi:hypothetical protein